VSHLLWKNATHRCTKFIRQPERLLPVIKDVSAEFKEETF